MSDLINKTDAQIQQDVITEINWDPSVTASEIAVTVNDGIVTLRGSVPHFHEKNQAEAAAQRVCGVKAVADEVEVIIMGSYERSDEQIARAALTALEWGYSVPRGIQVVVEKGWITLKGEAEWDYQRQAAKEAVDKLMGVCGVTNSIGLRVKVQPADVRLRIQEALTRSAEAEGRDIGVSVFGDKVTLSGSIGSFSEMEVAKHAAWMAPGVMNVVNNMNIT